jgi:hypothetical protein
MQDTKHARETLEDILNKQEYRIYYHDSKGFLETWWEKAKAWIAEQLAKLFPTMESANGAAVPVLITIIVLVIVLLVLTIFFIFRNAKRNQILRAKKPLQSLKEINWSVQKHLNEAREHETIEEYTVSTHHLFIALLLYLHEKEWLEVRIWKTNWEYYEELRKSSPHSANEFYHLASYFDLVMYGEQKVQKEEYIRFRTGVMKWLEEKELDYQREKEDGNP